MAGEWASVMATPPPMASGVPFLHPDNNVVIEIAIVLPDNVLNDDPFIEWADITHRVIEASWSEGATDGRESRWPIGTCTIDCYHLLAEVADWLTDDPETRLAPGSLLRVSMIDTDSETWYPQWSGIIDQITEADRPEPRTWRIVAYDVLYQASGATGMSFHEAKSAGQDLGEMIEDTFGYLDFWRFHLDIESSGLILSDAFNIEGNLLALAHRLADSYGHRLWAYRDGIVRSRAWDDIDNASASAQTVVDVHTPGMDEIYGSPLWSASTGRVAAYLSAQSSFETTANNATTSFDLNVKLGNRQDAPGWPKLDLLYGGLTDGDDLVGFAAPRFSDELSLDRIDIDTLRNRDDQNVFNSYTLELLRSYGAGDGLRFIRGFTHTGAAALDCELLILGAQHRIRPAADRWMCSYFPTILTYGPPP